MAFTVTYPGQNAGTGDARAKFLTLFTGEVLSAFELKNMALQMVKVRTISGGKSSQFITTGRADEANVAAHTPGTDVTTNILLSNEKTITITSRYYYSSFLDDLEQKLAQFEIRGELAKQHAEVLSTKIDRAVFKLIWDARLTTPQAGQTAAVSVTNAVILSGATAEAKGDAILDAVFSAQAALDANDVPMEGRQFVTKPVHYYNLVQSAKAVNRDFNGMDNGSIGGGRVLNIAGLSVVQSNHLPILETDGLTATNLCGMIFTQDVVGVVKAMDITSEENYIPEKLGSLLTSYYAMGMGILNPSPLAVIKTA